MKTIFINGLSGKMGKTINNLILDDPDFEIVKTIRNTKGSGETGPHNSRKGND